MPRASQMETPEPLEGAGVDEVGEGVKTEEFCWSLFEIS